MRKALFTKFSAIFILLMLLSAPLFAVDLNAYVELAQSGNISEIDTAFRQTPEIKNQTFGDNKETFLIIAIKNNRPLEIIELLVKFGCKVKTKSKDKRTTVMYAAKFNVDPDVMRLLIKESALTKTGRRNFINEQDEKGFTAFDYAKENPNAATIVSVLKDYEDLRDLDKEAKARAKEEQKAEKARQKEEEKAAKEAEKAAKEEEAKAKKEAEKAAKEEEKAAKEAEKAAKEEEAKAKKEAEKAAKEEEKAAKEAEKQKQKDDAKAAKEAEKAAKEAEKAQPKEEPKQETVQAKPAKQEQKQQTQYNNNDDFFKSSYNEADFITSQEEAESTPQQTTSQQAKTETKAEPKTASTSQQKQTQTNTTDRLQIPEEIKAQPYTKSYLFDYITDTTPESPAEESSKTASVTISNVDKQDRNGITLLMKAAKAGNDWDVQNLLANGANVQLRDKDGWSALMYAVRYQNNLSIVTKLIDSGAHVRVRNNVNTTPLLIAANYTQNPEILKLLLKDRTASEDEVYAAFILALTSEEGAEHVKVSKIKIFLEMGISVNRMWKGKTPLMYACQYGNSTEVLKLLMEAGARTSIQNQDGKTAFDYAGQNSALPHDDIYWSINSIGR